MKVKHKGNGKHYAMKSIRKEDILEPDNIEHTKMERKILQLVDSPFLVRLAFAFQTKSKIYFVMDFMEGGELFQRLVTEGSFEEEKAKFYAAEILLALEHLHSKNIIYRDLKPENVLLDHRGHVSITDFGMAKLLDHGAKTNSFVGTAEYLCPEIIEGEGHNAMADWWSLGILIFEMIYGNPPFFSDCHTDMFQMIRSQDVEFPDTKFVSENCKDAIRKLLTKDPN